MTTAMTLVSKRRDYGPFKCMSFHLSIEFSQLVSLVSNDEVLKQNTDSNYQGYQPPAMLEDPSP
jgi:hypothetical protein